MNSEATRKIQELQILEQNLQNLSMQKQALEMELSEIENALSELESSGDEVYKVAGPIMLKSNKDKISQDLKEKKKLIQLRTSSVEKQESLINTKAEELRKETQELLDKKDESN